MEECFPISGLTFASCKIIDIFQPYKKHIFNTKEQICYNGVNLDYYFLEYLNQRISSAKDPLFSFTALNIGHDQGGIRIQGLDELLKTFFQRISKAEDTLTIFFSDHGNTYTSYVFQELDGRYEQFHPTLLMVMTRN